MVLLLMYACDPNTKELDTVDYFSTTDTFKTDTIDSGTTRTNLSLEEQLRELPGVTVSPEYTGDPRYLRYNLHFTQLVDHNNPGGATFQQQATLMHRDENAPMVLVSTGYWNYYEDSLSEPTQMLEANQLVVEHRFFAESRPDPADWNLLTIAQAAADHHEIITLLKSIYQAAWVSTGASKGGMTSVYHRRFWPDDVAGTIPYVAPMSFGAPDYSYQDFYDQIGPADCRKSLQDLAAEMLKRRSMLEKRATSQANNEGWTYERVPIGPAVESAVQSMYWAFWQYMGVDYCSVVPSVTASDEELWTFLNAASSVTSSSDIYLTYFEAYYFQSDVELGYPGFTDSELEGLLQYSEADLEGIYPVGVSRPAFRPEAMEDVADWFQNEGDHFVFVYGEYDPWTGGRFDLGNAADTAAFTAPEGSHGSLIADLNEADRLEAISRIEAWTGTSGSAKLLTRPPVDLQPTQFLQHRR